MKFSILKYFYFVVVFFLLLYSFTQIDLSLTLSRASWIQSLEKWFQQIGYFQRPLSTYIFITIVLLMSLFYCYLLKISEKLKEKEVWVLIFATSIILLLSYNAFSYDLFNYIFDAKIIVHYHQNPFLHKALDFPGDPMLSFMHWTHRNFPYGPLWLVLTVPLVFLGFGYLIPTLILFKLLMVGAYIGSCYFLYKILRKTNNNSVLFGLILFAFNPLVIIESLVSAHLDIVMIFFSLWGINFLVENKTLSSFALVMVSGAVKFATFALIPILLIKRLVKKISWDMFFVLCLILMLSTTVLASMRTNFQPWYLLTAIPFCSLLAKKSFIVIPGMIISIFALLEYVPFLYNGNWDPPVPSLLQTIRLVGIVCATIIVCFRRIKSSGFS